MGISEKVSESLLAQLDRLEAVDASDADALRMEISRAKAVQGITGNLAAAFGVTDFAPYMQDCRIRNEERGRYGSTEVER